MDFAGLQRQIHTAKRMDAAEALRNTGHFQEWRQGLVSTREMTGRRAKDEAIRGKLRQARKWLPSAAPRA